MASASAMRCMSCKQEKEPSQLEHAANCMDCSRLRGNLRGKMDRQIAAAPDLAEEWKELPLAQMEHLRVEVQTLHVEMQQAAQRQDTMQQTMVQMQQMLAQMQQMLVQQQLQPVQQPPAPPPAVQQPAAAPPPPPAAPPPPARHQCSSRQPVQQPPAATTSTGAAAAATSAAAASPHQCNFHSQQASANLQRVDMSGGRQVPDVWQLDSEFSSMQATLFADDHRGEYELQNRLRSDFLAGRVRVVCARTRSGATRFWHTQCTHCLQFNHVEYGSWACQTPEDKARARQQLFLWHCPPIEGAPRIAPGAALPAGRPQV